MTQRHIFYGDLNCPFCYAQHERLKELGLVEHIVEWRGVEHMPELPLKPIRYPIGAAERRPLAEEIAAVRQRAKDVRISDISFRPNTQIAIAAITQAKEINTQKASQLRDDLYRALWIDGEDISDIRVVHRLVKKRGLPDFEPLIGTLRQGRIWRQEWEQGPFDRRLPTLVSVERKTPFGTCHFA